MALAEPTRRALLARLARGEASVAELAEPFDMSQPAISKHQRIRRSVREAVMDHPLLNELDIALRDLVPGEPVDVTGEWSQASRRTYACQAQIETGAGSFTDVVDRRWRGAFTGRSPIGGIAFLSGAGNLFWAKAPDISLALPVEVSLHAGVAHMPERATFTVRFAGAYLPGIPISVGPDLAEACSVERATVRTGQISCLARADSAAVFVLLFPRSVLEVGRRRLWRIRDEVGSSLPPAVRELLTRRRSGSVPGPRT